MSSSTSCRGDAGAGPQPVNGALERTMFWTGALIALMPVAIGLIVLWVVLRQRRNARNRSGDES